MQDYGVNLICVEDGIDSSKEAGKLLISIIAAVAEMERENIRIDHFTDVSKMVQCGRRKSNMEKKMIMNYKKKFDEIRHEENGVENADFFSSESKTDSFKNTNIGKCV